MLIMNINCELLVKCLIHWHFYTLATFTSSIYFNSGSYFIVYFTLFYLTSPRWLKSGYSNLSIARLVVHDVLSFFRYLI